MTDLSKYRERLAKMFGLRLKRHAKQSCFIYCPTCDVEMIAAGFHRETCENGLELFKCQCGKISHWDFGPPAPVLIRHPKPWTLRSEKVGP